MGEWSRAAATCEVVNITNGGGIRFSHSQSNERHKARTTSMFARLALGLGLYAVGALAHDNLPINAALGVPGFPNCVGRRSGGARAVGQMKERAD